MANLHGLTAAELKEYLSGQISKLQTLKTILIVVIVVVVVAVVGHIIYYYNYLTTLKYDVLASGGKVESAVQYRANLAPVLIESVVSFVEHEDNVFNRAVDARERSLSAARQVTDKLKRSPGQSIDEALQKIMAIAEQYPDLKTSEPFQLLMKQIGDVEVEIFNQRVEYNDRVNVYTTAISIFPGNFYAATMFDFPSFSYFKGNHRSEWPHFKGKSHSEWPQVSLQTEDADKVSRQTSGDKSVDRDKDSKEF